jgi:hypothetical protein
MGPGETKWHGEADPSADGSVVVLSVPWGLVLSTPDGLFLLRTTVGNPSREIDPAAAYDLVGAAPDVLSTEGWIMADRVA